MFMSFKLATALCFSSFLITFAFAEKETLYVKGKVYCDTCRVKFETKLSEPIEGATVALQCRERDDGDIVYSHEVETDESGAYKIPAQSGHAELICEVRLIKSPNSECNQIMGGLDSARIVLSSNAGVAEPVRHANDLGFMRKEPVAGCRQVLKEMGFIIV